MKPDVESQLQTLAPLRTRFAAAGYSDVSSPPMREPIRLWQQSDEAMRVGG